MTPDLRVPPDFKLPDKANLRTWDDGFRCAECCNGDRCDDRSHYDRQSCPHCKGTGNAIWKFDQLRSIATAAVALVGERDKEIALLKDRYDQLLMTFKAAEAECGRLREEIAAPDKWKK